MTQEIEIKLPVRSHYKKFCEKEYGSRFSIKDPLGLIVYHLLRKNETMEQVPVQKFVLNDFLILSVPQYYITDRALRTDFNESEKYHLNYLIKELMFEPRLFSFLDTEMEKGNEIQESVAIFMGKYDITHIDITSDALIKAYYRERKRKEKEISPTELSDINIK